MITIVTTICDEQIFNRMLGRAIREARDSGIQFEVVIKGAKNTIWHEYNKAKIKTEYVMFVSQDIYFKPSFLEQAEELCNSLGDLGMAGVTGWKREGTDVVGFWYKNHPNFPGTFREYGSKFDKPIEVQVVDGMLMIIPIVVWKREKFDEHKFDFHWGAQDYALTLQYKYGRKIYVLPLPIWEDCISTSSTEHQDKHGVSCEKYLILENKWKGKVDKIAGRRV